MRLWRTLAVAGVVAAAGCGGETEERTRENVFPTLTVAPGDDFYRCQSWTLDNPKELWVTRVDIANAGGFHHSNWYYVPDDTYVVEDGVWDCGEQDFEELTAAILGGFLFAQATQSTDQEQTFNDGAAIRIPPYSRIIGQTHLFNASDTAIETAMTMRLETLPAEEVGVKLTPFRIEYLDLSVPAGAQAEFRTECDIAAAYEETMGEPLVFELYYALPHFHEWGNRWRLELLGGERDGEVLHEVAIIDNSATAFDPPIDLAALGARGLSLTCGFHNTTGTELRYGNGDGEMCVLGGFARTNMGFSATVDDGSGVAAGERDGVLLNEGPCAIWGVPWAHDKEGGPPR